MILEESSRPMRDTPARDTAHQPTEALPTLEEIVDKINCIILTRHGDVIDRDVSEERARNIAQAIVEYLKYRPADA